MPLLWVKIGPKSLTGSGDPVNLNIIALHVCGRQNHFTNSINVGFRPTIRYSERGDATKAFGWSRAAETGARYFLLVRFSKLCSSTFGRTHLREPAYV